MPCIVIVVFFLLTTIQNCSTKIGFWKDPSTDVQFPPYIEPAGRGLPDGHLRPLGWQRRSSGKIVETPEMPSAHGLYIKYLKNNKPAFIHDALQNVKIMKDWESDKYLNRQYGELNVSVTVKKERAKHEKEPMKFKKFLLDYMHEEWYLATTVPEEMMNELPLPKCLKCGTFYDRLYDAHLWMSSGGTTSLLHSHEDHDLHCVLFGRKDFVIIDEKYKWNFEYKETYLHSGAGYSPVDVDRVNMFKYKEIANTPWNHATLREGDCILIPAGYLHQVRSYGRSISFSILFAPSNEYDSSDCQKVLTHTRDVKEVEDTTRRISLSDANFLWISKSGNRVLNTEKMEPENLKKILLLILRSKPRLYKEQFEHFYNEALEQFPEKPPASEAFDVLTSNLNRDYMSRDEIEKLSESRLLHVSRILNEAKRPAIKKRDEL